MANKASSVDSQPMAAAGALPPPISLADHLLSSAISLPQDPSILCSVFTSSDDSDTCAHETVELFRRHILLEHRAPHLLDSLLANVQVTNRNRIYVFAIAAGGRLAEKRAALRGLHFDGLISIEFVEFDPRGLYPCSLACSSLSVPCQTCLDTQQRQSDAPLLPRLPLRECYDHFLEAAKTRLIDDIAEASNFTESDRTRPVKRFRGGFLLGPPPSGTEWATGWEHYALARPLVYCHLHLYLTNSAAPRIIIHPVLRSTHFLPLPLALPLTSGTPITLIPHGTPAYFISCYSGPTSALTRQFGDSLRGLGVGDWKSAPVYAPSRPQPPQSHEDIQRERDWKSIGQSNGNDKDLSCMYILAWINVQNKQGEDKGITVIWPARLCLAFVSSSPSRKRQGLGWVPELPVQLQPSPPLAPREPGSIRSSTPTAAGTSNVLSPNPVLVTETLDRHTQAHHSNLFQSLARRSRAVSASPTSDSLRAFRTLTLNKSKDIRQVASEVGRYIDAVYKERERDRERIRREREGNSSSPMIGKAVATPVPVATPTTLPTDATVSNNVSPQAGRHSPIDTTLPIVGGPGQIHTLSHQYYPSPPQTNQGPTLPPAAALTSPVVDSLPQLLPSSGPNPSENVAASTIVPVPAPAPSDAPPPTSYDASVANPFDPFDAAWSQPAQPTTDFMGMGMNMDVDMGMDFGMGMGFGMNMDPIASSGGGGGGGDYERIGMDFEDAFTDDDFSFFDQPSAAKSAPPPPLPLPSHQPLLSHMIGGSSTGLAPIPTVPLGMSPSLFGDGTQIPLSDGRAEPTPQQHHSSPWTIAPAADTYTPRFADVLPPDTLPPSPGRTPDSQHSSPQPLLPAPTVQLARARAPEGFDPIPFAASHRVADGKYAVGKFAFSLPSPPDEEDRTEPLQLPDAGGVGGGWRTTYATATDPRIGVVRKLIGVKRKVVSTQGARKAAKSGPSWAHDLEEWMSTPVEDGDDEEPVSEVESEDDAAEECHVTAVSRPCTPLPAYLPLGPTLLHTQFHHSHLLPLSTPLRPPGAAVAPTSIAAAPAPVSVPTPVSPAATLGAASEKSKSLEAAATTVAREVVENAVWSQAWRANMLGMTQTRSVTDVWQTDVKAVNQLLSNVPASDGSLSVASLFGLDVDSQEVSRPDTKVPLQMLESPMISVGKGDAVIHILPTALRFWEKLGLGPRGGRKNITAFALFEDLGIERQQKVEAWLANVGSAYNAKQFGVQTLGACPGCSKDGIVPIRFDSFRKTLTNFVANLPAAQSNLVFYMITPTSIMTLASPLLRQVFAAVKKAQKAYPEGQILFQFVPEHLVIGSTDNPTSRDSTLDLVSHSVYNRVLKPVNRLMSRRFFEHGERICNYFQEPLFTLARPPRTNVKLVWQTPVQSLDVLDRHTLLQVGYQITPCGKWILAACVDQRGEAHDLGVWLTQSEGNEAYTVTRVWNFAVQFARKASIEWRIVIAKLGAMGPNELDAWTVHLASAVSSQKHPMVHVSLLSTEPDVPWTFMPPHVSKRPPPLTRTSSKNSSGVLFVDVSATTYILHPTIRMPQSFPAPARSVSTELPFVPDVDEEPPCENGHILPLATTTLIRVPADSGYTSISMLHLHLLHTVKSANSSLTTPDVDTLGDITHNYHELSVLAGTRFRLEVNPILPFHLAAVEAMYIALDRGDVLVES